MLSLDPNHISGEKCLVYSSTLRAYYNYLVLVGAPAHMYSQYIHMCLISYLRKKRRSKKESTEEGLRFDVVAHVHHIKTESLRSGFNGVLVQFAESEV
jgi:hypothetical protein